MNIGIDIDDTICDSTDFYNEHIAKYFNVSMDYINENNIYYYNLNDFFGEDSEKRFFKEYTKLNSLDIKLKDNVKQIMDKLKENGHKITFITARSDDFYGDAYKKTEEQINSYGINYDKIICTHKKREAAINEKIDILIDDLIKNCDEVSAENIEVLVFNSKININTKTKHNRVNDWKEVYEYILRISERV